MQLAVSSRLRVETEQVSNAFLICPEGEVDTESYDVFRRVLADATAAGRPNVVLDLARVTYIDSMGLGAIVCGLRDAREAGCRLMVVSENPQLSRLFQITGLANIFEVYQDRTDAMRETEGDPADEVDA